jgi:Holliday junction resolvase
MSMRRANRVDRNHAELREALKAKGYYVLDCAGHGNGHPDLIGVKNGRVVFGEVKDGSKIPSKQQLTEKEAAVLFALKQAGAEVHVLRRLSDLEQL